MKISEWMEVRKITKYRLAKESGVPYTTINDICNEKTDIVKCSVETIYHIAQALDVSMESLVESYMEKRTDFELYKSDICHKVKELGDVEFIIEILEKDDIRRYYKKRWYRECLYLLGMLDYLSRENNIPVCTEYDDMRGMKLKDTLYPASVLMAARAAKDDKIKRKALEAAIPEFIRFNIVESEVRNVV